MMDDYVRQRAMAREQAAGFRPPVSGKPTRGRKSPYIDMSRLDLDAERVRGTAASRSGLLRAMGSHRTTYGGRP